VNGSIFPQRWSLRPGSAGLRSLAVLALALLAAAPAGAEEEPESAPPPGGDAPGTQVDLDRLLRLPDSMEYDVEKRGGATADEWRGRFRRARQEVASARERVQRAQEQLKEEAASESAWNVAPPGLGALGGAAQGSSEGTSNYQLSMALRRAKEDLDRSERALRNLTIEANLAGVPESWRE